MTCGELLLAGGRGRIVAIRRPAALPRVFGRSALADRRLRVPVGSGGLFAVHGIVPIAAGPQHRIHALTAQQMQRGAVVQLDVVEGVGDDLGRPGHAGAQVAGHRQLQHAEGQAAHADPEPHQAQLVQVLDEAGRRREHAEQTRLQPQQHRRRGPQAHQHDLAAQVVADLDLLLVLMRGLVHLVVALGLEEEVTRLAAGHRHAPGQQRGPGGIDQQQAVGDHEAAGAQQVQRLVDAAMVVVAVVVPALFVQECQKVFHAGLVHG
ncbi:conserved hypothetical protein [Ricinus communis]|uniref:Uncharacterized protein n=1 Tax=Ricinus communis TaxID=3988 RepID=B9TLG5_RICCO|nr:conserved hypothetical protein [Ricinus communis]